MAIDVKRVESNPLAATRLSSQGTTGNPSSSAGRAGSQTPGDRISLTDTAVSLGNIERILAQIPVVDAGRVEATRESLAEGSYQVDPLRTADKFIRFEMMLDSASRGPASAYA